MNSILLMDRLRDALKNHQVKAAVFHTYNFDPEFFENYLLPAFLPDLPFSDNKIQNSILWRRYHTRLPPITVYCDFYGKTNMAPQLPYIVNSVDMASYFQEKTPANNKTGCFHPKHCFLLLDDSSLIVMTGSNNMTASGWCSNLEVFSLVHLKNGQNFPRDLKDAFSAHILRVHADHGSSEMSDAEIQLATFFRRQKYTGNVASSPGTDEWCRPSNFPLYYSSINGSFFDFLAQLKTHYNNEDDFTDVEIISPYYAKSAEIINKISAVTGASNIRLSVPFSGIDTVAMDRETFDAYATYGAWCIFSEESSSKGFRFNHSKLWRIKGAEYMFTIVGSVNCTMAACIGIADRDNNDVANIETAFVYVEPVANWKSLLNTAANPTFFDFNIEGQNDDPGYQRFSGVVPKLGFCIDWSNSQLTCSNEGSSEITGMILDNRRRVKIPPQSKITLSLVTDEVLSLSDNPIIDFHYSGKRNQVWHFYVSQTGYLSKPIPYRLKLNDTQVLELWKNLGNQSAEHKAHQFIEDLLEAVCREDGVVDDKSDLLQVSTLNMMAAHLSGLLNLESWVQTQPKNSRERKLHAERLKYYLTTKNIDTIPGYLELITKKYHDGEINSAFFWIILELLIRDIYRRVTKSDEAFLEKKLLDQYLDQMTTLQKSLKFKDARLTKEHLKWAANELK